MVRRPDDPTRLNACGLIVVKPPWTLREEAEILLPALADRLARGGLRRLPLRMAAGAPLTPRLSRRT